MRVALLNCSVLPDPDPDEAPLLAALQRAGVVARTVAWDAPGAADEAADVWVIRATWNYYRMPDAFLAFLESREGVMLNPMAAVQQNIHKGYLLDLEAAGLPVVPTTLVRRGQNASIPQWDEIVIKPAVSAGSWLTKRFASGDAYALAFLEDCLQDRDMLVQPALPGFADPGERSLVWLDGEFRHGIRKRPRLSGEEECVEALYALSESDIAVARRAVSTLPDGIVYARVDLVDAPEGTLISEIEAIEPSLFFWANPGSEDILAEAIVRALR